MVIRSGFWWLGTRTPLAYANALGVLCGIGLVVVATLGRMSPRLGEAIPAHGHDREQNPL